MGFSDRVKKILELSAMELEYLDNINDGLGKVKNGNEEDEKNFCYYMGEGGECDIGVKSIKIKKGDICPFCVKENWSECDGFKKF